MTAAFKMKRRLVWENRFVYWNANLMGTYLYKKTLSGIGALKEEL
jgi:hypothetical protein